MAISDAVRLSGFERVFSQGGNAGGSVDIFCRFLRPFERAQICVASRACNAALKVFNTPEAIARETEADATAYLDHAVLVMGRDAFSQLPLNRVASGPEAVERLVEGMREICGPAMLQIVLEVYTPRELAYQRDQLLMPIRQSIDRKKTMEGTKVQQMLAQGTLGASLQRLFATTVEAAPLAFPMPPGAEDLPPQEDPDQFGF